MTSTTYQFDWDEAKAATNSRKHGVEFTVAATVFRDPLALSRYDEVHSEGQDRWITLGQAENGNLLVVIHTFVDEAVGGARIRIISARPATAHERRHYQS